MVSFWILAILMLLAASLVYRARMEIKLSSISSKRIKSREMAINAIEEIVRILREDNNSYDSLNENWALSHGEGDIDYHIFDEERKINLNVSSKEVISAIPGIGDDIADAVIDWRDEDDVPLPQGAEDIYYMNLTPPYHCKDSPIESMEEMLLIKGITPQVVQAISPLTTIYGHGRLNINTAPEEVLKIFFSALEYPASLADRIIFYRQGLDGVEGTDDDNIFEEVSTIKDNLLEYGLTPDEEISIEDMTARSIIDVSSSCYRAIINTSYEGRYLFNAEAILSKEDGKVRVIYWKEK